MLEQGALDELLPRCVAEGTSLVIGGPYNSGILAGGGAATYNYAPAPASVRDKAARIEAVCAQRARGSTFHLVAAVHAGARRLVRRTSPTFTPYLNPQKIQGRLPRERRAALVVFVRT